MCDEKKPSHFELSVPLSPTLQDWAYDSVNPFKSRECDSHRKNVRIDFSNFASYKPRTTELGFRKDSKPIS